MGNVLKNPGILNPGEELKRFYYCYLSQLSSVLLFQDVGFKNRGLGNIVAETLFPDMFPWVAKLGNIRFGSTIASVKQKCL